jgi:hypothetical protein
VATTPDRTGPRRPVEVTVVMALTMAHAALLLLAGAVILMTRRNAEVAEALEMPASALAVAGGVVLALGLAEALVALGLGRGRDLFRSVFAVVATLRIAPATYTLVALKDVRSGGLMSLVVSLVVLWLLYGPPRSQEYFAR